MDLHFKIITLNSNNLNNPFNIDWDDDIFLDDLDIACWPQNDQDNSKTTDDVIEIIKEDDGTI